jgi:hypothetical protein
MNTASFWRRLREVVPEPVRAVHGRALIAFFGIQVPATIVLFALHKVAQNLGAFSSRPLLGAWLTGLALLPMLWPFTWLRVAVEAARAAPAVAANIASHLRALALLFSLLALACAAAGVVYLIFLLQATSSL